MSENVIIEVAQPPFEKVWVACGACGASTRHEVLSFVRLTDSDDDAGIVVWEDYMIVECRGCATVSFCVKSRSTEDVGYDRATGDEELIETTKLYPSHLPGRRMENSHHLPFLVYSIYNETVDAMSHDQRVLAGIGIRAIVETVCKDQQALGKDLREKIDDLAKKGVVTPDGASILHSLRFMGNDAAHEVKAHTSAELAVALEVVELTLAGVYVVPRLAKSLPAKGTSKPAATTQPAPVSAVPGSNP